MDMHDVCLGNDEITRFPPDNFRRLTGFRKDLIGGLHSSSWAPTVRQSTFYALLGH